MAEGGSHADRSLLRVEMVGAGLGKSNDDANKMEHTQDITYVELVPLCFIIICSFETFEKNLV